MKQKGFTLIEAVVSAGVFAFVVSSIIGVYLAAVQIDRKTRSQRAVVENARFITEFLSKEIRNGYIDYASYPSGNSNAFTTEVNLINEANETERIYCNGTASPPGHLTLSKGSQTTNLNSSNVLVTRCNLYVIPTANPFTPAMNANEQPRVTLVLGLVSNFGSRPEDEASLNVQSTFTTRYYPSRE